MEGLEDEAHVVAPELGQTPFGEPVDPPVRQPQLTGGRPVEPTEEVEERRLPTAARAHDGHRLAAGDLEVDLVDGAHQSLAAPVVLA